MRYLKFLALEFLIIYAVAFAVNAMFHLQQNYIAIALSSLVSAAIIALAMYWPL